MPRVEPFERPVAGNMITNHQRNGNNKVGILYLHPNDSLKMAYYSGKHPHTSLTIT